MPLIGFRTFMTVRFVPFLIYYFHVALSCYVVDMFSYLLANHLPITVLIVLSDAHATDTKQSHWHIYTLSHPLYLWLQRFPAIGPLFYTVLLAPQPDATGTIAASPEVRHYTQSSEALLSLWCSSSRPCTGKITIFSWTSY